MKKLLMLLVHFAISILIQAGLFTTLIWYYDTSLIAYEMIVLQCIVALLVDYAINGCLLRKTNLLLKRKLLFHLSDLMLALPCVLCIVANIALKILDPTDSIESSYILTSLVILFIDTLSVTERLSLILQK